MNYKFNSRTEKQLTNDKTGINEIASRFKGSAAGGFFHRLAIDAKTVLGFYSIKDSLAELPAVARKDAELVSEGKLLNQQLANICRLLVEFQPMEQRKGTIQIQSYTFLSENQQTAVVVEARSDSSEGAPGSKVFICAYEKSGAYSDLKIGNDSYRLIAQRSPDSEKDNKKPEVAMQRFSEIALPIIMTQLSPDGFIREAMAIQQALAGIEKIVYYPAGAKPAD